MGIYRQPVKLEKLELVTVNTIWKNAKFIFLSPTHSKIKLTVVFIMSMNKLTLVNSRMTSPLTESLDQTKFIRTKADGCNGLGSNGLRTSESTVFTV